MDLINKMAPAMLPVLLLFLSFVVKMSVERQLDLPKALQSFAELPADIMFLSMSLCVAFSLSSQDNMPPGLLVLLAFLVLSIFVIIMWRKAEAKLAGKSWPGFIFICAINYIVAIPALVGSVLLNIR